MDAGSYSKNIIDVIDKHSKLFYIRANKSADLFEQINNISNWETVEINYKNYEVASIPFTQFYKDRNYRLVIMREKSADTQLDMFTQDIYTYRHEYLMENLLEIFRDVLQLSHPLLEAIDLSIKFCKDHNW